MSAAAIIVLSGAAVLLAGAFAAGFNLGKSRGGRGAEDIEAIRTRAYWEGRADGTSTAVDNLMKGLDAANAARRVAEAKLASIFMGRT